MSFTVEYNGGAVPDRVMVDGGFHVSETAATGVVGVSEVNFDDPDGDFEPVAFKDIILDESACTPSRLFTGNVFGVVIERGSYKHGEARVHHATVRDQNERLLRRVIHTADGKRPAETDVARLAWLLGHASLDGLVEDLGLANMTDNIRNLDEGDFIGRYPMDVLVDMAPQCGKTSFVYYDEDEDAFGLFYDVHAATGPDSTLSISNDQDDHSSTCLYPYLDATLERDPSDTYSGEYLRYVGGAIYDFEATTITNYGERDFFYDSSRIGKLTTAQASQAQFLADHANPFDTITCSVEVDNTNVNLIRAGMRLAVKFVHLPDFGQDGDFHWTRVVQRDIRHRLSDRTKYQLDLKLSTSVFAGIGNGGSGGFPNPPPSGDHWWSGGGIVFANDGIVAGTPDLPAGSWVPGIYTYTVAVNQADNPGGTYATDVGISPALNFVPDAVWMIDSVPGPRGTDWIYSGSFEVDALFETHWISGVETANYGKTIDPDVIHSFIANAAGNAAYNKSSSFSWIIDLEGFGDEEAIPPQPGQLVIDETPVLTDPGPPGVYTTRWPYADGSLRVFVDNLNETGAVIETDPATGEFTLAFVPNPSEQLRVTYQGR